MNQADFEAIDARLVNWARWANGEGSGRQRCASAEGQYRPTAVDDDKHEYARSGVIDSVDAELVEAIVCTLPIVQRRFLKGFYVDRSPKMFIAKLFNIPLSSIEEVRRVNVEEVGRLYLRAKQYGSKRLHSIKLGIMTGATI